MNRYYPCGGFIQAVTHPLKTVEKGYRHWDEMEYKRTWLGNKAFTDTHGHRRWR
jgi:hypothetical protein